MPQPQIPLQNPNCRLPSVADLPHVALFQQLVSPPFLLHVGSPLLGLHFNVQPVVLPPSDRKVQIWYAFLDANRPINADLFRAFRGLVFDVIEQLEFRPSGTYLRLLAPTDDGILMFGFDHPAPPPFRTRLIICVASILFSPSVLNPLQNLRTSLSCFSVAGFLPHRLMALTSHNVF